MILASYLAIPLAVTILISFLQYIQSPANSLAHQAFISQKLALPPNLIIGKGPSVLLKTTTALAPVRTNLLPICAF